MNRTRFYQEVSVAFALPPQERHQHMSDLHAQILDEYVGRAMAITAADAAQIVPIEGDERTLAQIVGHIGAWDRFAILTASDILVGVHPPRMVFDVKGYVEPDGTTLSFAGIDDFNAYHARQHATWIWGDIQRFAVDMAQALYAMFASPYLLTATRLENTLTYQKRLKNGTMLTDITIGWWLWLTQLEHAAIEHARELGVD